MCYKERFLCGQESSLGLDISDTRPCHPAKDLLSLNFFFFFCGFFSSHAPLIVTEFASQPWSDTHEFTIKIQLPGLCGGAHNTVAYGPLSARPRKIIITRQSINIFNSSSKLMASSGVVDQFLSLLVCPVLFLWPVQVSHLPASRI